MPVFLIGTLDTKGQEVGFVRDLLRDYGVDSQTVDAGCLGQPTIAADISREEVFAAAGASVAELQQAADRGRAVTAAARGTAEIITEAHQQGQVDGVLGLGGSAGTTIATQAMRRLPLGVPKLMVSTLASGQTRPYVGDKDILMLNPVVDISGINRISRAVLTQAARAMAGMVNFRQSTAGDGADAASDDKPLIAATMFGVTTPCVEHARKILEQAGYEVLVFHATGTGGQAMESLIDDGMIAGVLDITTTELADELVGGLLSAGPERLTAAARRGIPQVISVGATDMVNFGPPETVPDRFSDRTFHHHNPTVTLMRTTVDENRRIGEEIGRKAAAAVGPTTIVLPRRGVSAIDAEGQPFDNPAAREALFHSIRESAGSIPVIERDEHLNHNSFAETAATQLLQLMTAAEKRLPAANRGG